MWLSLVERCVRDAEAAGSNPVISTNIKGYTVWYALYYLLKIKKGLNLKKAGCVKENSPVDSFVADCSEAGTAAKSAVAEEGRLRSKLHPVISTNNKGYTVWYALYYLYK